MAGAKKFGTNIRIALLVLSGHVALTRFVYYLCRVPCHNPLDANFASLYNDSLFIGTEERPKEKRITEEEEEITSVGKNS